MHVFFMDGSLLTTEGPSSYAAIPRCLFGRDDTMTMLFFGLGARYWKYVTRNNMKEGLIYGNLYFPLWSFPGYCF